MRGESKIARMGVKEVTLGPLVIGIARRSKSKGKEKEKELASLK